MARKQACVQARAGVQARVRAPGWAGTPPPAHAARQAGAAPLVQPRTPPGSRPPATRQAARGPDRRRQKPKGSAQAVPWTWTWTRAPAEPQLRQAARQAKARPWQQAPCLQQLPWLQPVPEHPAPAAPRAPSAATWTPGIRGCHRPRIPAHRAMPRPPRDCRRHAQAWPAGAADPRRHRTLHGRRRSAPTCEIRSWSATTLKRVPQAGQRVTWLISDRL